MGGGGSLKKIDCTRNKNTICYLQKWALARYKGRVELSIKIAYSFGGNPIALSEYLWKYPDSMLILTVTCFLVSSQPKSSIASALEASKAVHTFLLTLMLSRFAFVHIYDRERAFRPTWQSLFAFNNLILTRIFRQKRFSFSQVSLWLL